MESSDSLCFGRSQGLPSANRFVAKVVADSGESNLASDGSRSLQTEGLG